MNFFEHQDRARSHTGKLLLLFFIAVLTLVLLTTFFITAVLAWGEGQQVPRFGVELFDSRVFLGVGIVVVAVVLLGAWYRIAQLRRGGRVIAESLGGRLLERSQASSDELKILNVVEEMALASGLPVPPVYLIEDDAINAFAAGYQLHDAVIGITRGAVRLLKRDELQGVIAHEFSHVFNGDMRLNLQLVGWLHGLLLLGVAGRSILRAPRRERRRGKGEGTGLLIGLILVTLGYAGILFGNLIKSAVSRQREFLADASAVQYTRNPDGIGNALKKIGGYPLGSRMLTRDASEINHMLFGEPVYGIATLRWFATHPPLRERIKRIDPRWDGQLINPDRPPATSFSTIPESATGHATTSAGAMQLAALADHIIESVGAPTAASLELAQQHLAAIPQQIRNQLDSALGAMLLMWALLIADSDEQVAAQQLALLEQQLDPPAFKLLRTQLEMMRATPLAMRHDIVELAQPPLFQLSSAQRESFLRTVDLMTQVDGQLSLYEWGLSRLLQHHLAAPEAKGGKLELAVCSEECLLLLSALTHAGHQDGGAAAAAFRAGHAALGLPNPAGAMLAAPAIPDLDRAIKHLQQLRPLQKPRLLKAMVLCIQHDARIDDRELTLLRVVATLLDCPIPPLRV